MDRMAKVLLALIAAGPITIIGPKVAYAQDYSRALASIVDDLGRIQRGTCTNSKIC